MWCVHHYSCSNTITRPAQRRGVNWYDTQRTPCTRPTPVEGTRDCCVNHRNRWRGHTCPPPPMIFTRARTLRSLLCSAHATILTLSLPSGRAGGALEALMPTDPPPRWPPPWRWSNQAAPQAGLPVAARAFSCTPQAKTHTNHTHNSLAWSGLRWNRECSFTFSCFDGSRHDATDRKCCM